MSQVILNNLRFDARPDRTDFRDRDYRPPLRSLPPEYPPAAAVETLLPRYTKDEMILDQGTEGACTGFGLAAVVNYLFWRELRVTRNDRRSRPPAKASERMLYHLARFYDEWEGEDYDGSSCRGAIKGWHHHGVCAAELWPYRDGRGNATFVPPSPGWEADAAGRPLGAYYRIDKGSVADMQAALAEVGAIYASADVHDGWFGDGLQRVPGLALPVIGPMPADGKTGGHAFAIVGYNPHGFIVQNSWGPSWGAGGFAVLPYAEWTARGSDAWVAVMGAPTLTPAPRYLSPVSLTELSATQAARVGAAADRLAAPRRGDVAPWSPDDGYRHAVVLGNNGIVISRDVTASDALDALRRAVLDAPRAWLADHDRDDIVFYAHGGLNDEAAGLGRARLMAPYFDVNEIYPVFFIWKTGFLESLQNVVGDAVKGILPAGAWRDVLQGVKDAAGEAKDRAVEAACQRVLVRAVWSEMKQNAHGAAHEANATLALTVQHLAALKQARPALRIHLVGHSAGAIFLGFMTEKLKLAGLRVASLTLFAPACSVPFALKYYRPALEAGVVPKARTAFEILTDELELADSVGPYGKSLLYLVSRALEDHHKMPLLGMAQSWQQYTAEPGRHPFGNEALCGAVNEWVASWTGAPPVTLQRARTVFDGEADIPAAHGAFDNDLTVLTRTILRIRDGAALKQPVTNLHGF
ncbi:MAG TPA: C1 family peptidase [Methylomirabilota bacterium]